MSKTFLDLQGLALYDELIKKYIGDSVQDADVSDALEQLTADILALANCAVAENTAATAANTAAIAILNGDDTTDGSVKQIVKNSVESAIADVVDSAPEAFDTLKEISDWIANDTTASAAMVNRIADLEDAAVLAEQNITDLKEYVDTLDAYYYDLILSIKDINISALFPTELAADKSAVQTINELESGTAVKLIADLTISDDITITKDCYINANGSTFTGTVTVPADADVVIENATFANPVVVA